MVTYSKTSNVEIKKFPMGPQYIFNKVNSNQDVACVFSIRRFKEKQSETNIDRYIFIAVVKYSCKI